MKIGLSLGRSKISQFEGCESNSRDEPNSSNNKYLIERDPPLSLEVLFIDFSDLIEILSIISPSTLIIGSEICSMLLVGTLGSKIQSAVRALFE